MTPLQPYLLNAILQHLSPPSLLQSSLVSPAYLNTEIFFVLARSRQSGKLIVLC